MQPKDRSVTSPRKTYRGMRGDCIRPPRKTPNKSAPPSAIMKRPYGLQSLINAAHYLKSQVCVLEAAIGPEVQSLKPLLTVLDTGAGPDLIRADLLAPEVLASCDTKRPITNLASVSNHRLDTT